MSRSPSGRHFLQIPGPTPPPERVLQALGSTAIDHRGEGFADLTRRVLARLQPLFGTTRPITTFVSSGTGALEAALVNTTVPGDTVVCLVAGHFATVWTSMAEALGLEVVTIATSWRQPPDVDRLETVLAADDDHKVKAVLVVHTETSTGVTCNIELVRHALDHTQHPALLIVDAISSIGIGEYRHDAWRVDATVSCSQKGLMLPPGLGFNVASARALERSCSRSGPRFYWDWNRIITANQRGHFPFTPATTLLMGLDEALTVLEREGLENVFTRHARHGAATRVAVRAWGLEVFCEDDRFASPGVTAVLLPRGTDAAVFRRLVHDEFETSLGVAFGDDRSRGFRIGHLGHLNDASLIGALGAVEGALIRGGVGVAASGVAEAVRFLGGTVDTDATQASP